MTALVSALSAAASGCGLPEGQEKIEKARQIEKQVVGSQRGMEKKLQKCKRPWKRADEPTKVSKFDDMYSPENIAGLTDDVADHVWAVSEILEPDTFAGSQVKATVTPDGAWLEHDDPSQWWDDSAWLGMAHRVLQQHRARLALRYVLLV